MKHPLIKVWRRDGFKLKLYDMQRQDHLGKWVLGYKFYDHDKLIFKGEDYHCSPLHRVDSKATVYSLLSYLSLQPGDTDAEYFEGYSKAQMEWVVSGRAEELDWLIQRDLGDLP